MGKFYLILVAIMIFIAVSLSGLFVPFPRGKDADIVMRQYTCCDSGDGENCRPNTSTGFTFKGERYNLLKTNILLSYGATQDITVEHMDVARTKNREDILTPNGSRIFLNRGETRGSDVYPECVGRGRDNKGYDRLYGEPDSRNTGEGSAGKGCYAIPNDLLVYVCRSDSPGNCFAPDSKKGEPGELFSGDLKFDVYIRQKDVDKKGVPNVIKNCYKPPSLAGTEKKIVFRPSPGGQANLQLRTFKFVSDIPPNIWLTPYCKPAVYLYPEKRTEINVSVFPEGKMLLTIPPYPKTGWDVVADPDGTIHSGSNIFDYLYYEASLPDQLIQKPDRGYVVSFDERFSILDEIISSLGLQGKEKQQFLEYWVPILPKSPYYFIGVVPFSTLNDISPLVITPKPDHVIRVTLYFQPLEKPVTVLPPLLTPVTRNGFTVVEWGGLYKQDTNHPFTCFM